MTDYFAVLDEPRRPWLEEDRLKDKFHRLSLGSHPDTRRPGSEESLSDSPFAAVNQAYQVLRDPKQRLQHLLLLQGIRASEAGGSIPAELADLFWETGAVLRTLDAVLGKLRTAENSLARALLKRELLEAEKKGHTLLASLTTTNGETLDSLRALDATWLERLEDRWDALTALYQKLSYLVRWIAQLREKLFQLSL